MIIYPTSFYQSVNLFLYSEAPGPVEGIEYHPLTSSILLVNCTNQSLSVARGIILQYKVTIVQYTGDDRQITIVNGSQFEVQFNGLSKFVV